MINPRFLVKGPILYVPGYAPSGTLFLSGPEDLTSRTLAVPGQWLSSPTGVCCFFEPDPEWLREHDAQPNGESWRIVEKTLFGAVFEYDVPAMWGLSIDTDRSRLCEPLGDAQGTGR